MKILITGSTGFLGKKVLELLVQDSRISSIEVISRKRLRHPNTKVRTHQLDLANPTSVPDLTKLVHGVNQVIHLAGLYDFKSAYAANFQNNVLPAIHLVQALHRAFEDPKSAPAVHFSSTFAVGLGLDGPLAEEPLEALAPRRFSYSHTKGIAERVFFDSPFKTFAFRLGALTGSMNDHGFVEKIDGPYVLLDVLQKVSTIPGAKFLTRMPVLADPTAIVPILPVDTAARIFHEALFNKKLLALPKAHLGAFNDQSIQASEIIELSVKHFFPRAKPFYVTQMPRILKLMETNMLPGTGEIFEFSLRPVRVQSKKFELLFPKLKIPAFSDYKTEFFQGFQTFCEDQRT